MSEREGGHIKTGITNLIPGKILVRGYPLDELIGNISYGEMVYLAIKGELPSRDEAKMFDALLLAITDHSLVGAAAPSARIVVAGNPDPIHGIVTGVLSIGPVTGSPRESAHFIQNAYKMMKEQNLRGDTADEIVTEHSSKKERIPGYGHPLFKEVDIRAARLRELAEKYGFIGEKLRLYGSIHDKFLQKLGKNDIVINVDGMMAAIMCEMGFDDDLSDIVGVLSYLPRICAHTYEGLKEKSAIRVIFSLMGELAEYTGTGERHLPQDRIRMG